MSYVFDIEQHNRDVRASRAIARAKESLGERYCLARPVERVRREIPAFLRLVSTETLIAELDRRRKLA